MIRFEYAQGRNYTTENAYTKTAVQNNLVNGSNFTHQLSFLDEIDNSGSHIPYYYFPYEAANIAMTPLLPGVGQEVFSETKKVALNGSVCGDTLSSILPGDAQKDKIGFVYLKKTGNTYNAYSKFNNKEVLLVSNVMCFSFFFITVAAGGDGGSTSMWFSGAGGGGAGAGSFGIIRLEPGKKECAKFTLGAANNSTSSTIGLCDTSAGKNEQIKIRLNAGQAGGERASGQGGTAEIVTPIDNLSTEQIYAIAKNGQDGANYNTASQSTSQLNISVDPWAFANQEGLANIYWSSSSADKNHPCILNNNTPTINGATAQKSGWGGISFYDGNNGSGTNSWNANGGKCSGYGGGGGGSTTAFSARTGGKGAPAILEIRWTNPYCINDNK